MRKISSGEGVERTFQTYSPLIASIEVKRRGDVRRAKLYYLRGRSGKSARIREKLAHTRERKPRNDAARARRLTALRQFKAALRAAFRCGFAARRGGRSADFGEWRRFLLFVLVRSVAFAPKIPTA